MISEKAVLAMVVVFLPPAAHTSGRPREITGPEPPKLSHLTLLFTENTAKHIHRTALKTKR